jgi:hypothetical protein
MSVNNTFVNNRIPEAIINAFASGYKTESVSVLSTDTIYGYLVQDAGGETATDLFVKVEGLNKENDPDAVEMAFLRALGLLLERGDDVYIHHLAEIFYGEEGYFKKPVLGAEQALVKLLYNYTLPGRYWQAHYIRQMLPTDIYPTTALEGYKAEVADTLLKLMNHK